MITWEGWRGYMRGSDIPFLEDPPRAELVGLIRNDVIPVTASADAALHVFGNAGVGKSRACLHALDHDGVRERVLYAPTPQQVPATFLGWVIQDTETRLVLVVDECPFDEARGFAGFSAASGGRLRLITIGDRGPHRNRMGGADARELLPLESEALADALEAALGLTGSDARFVARHTQGYPRLAWHVAREVAGAPERIVTDIAHVGFVSDTLERMLPSAEARELLGVLALFSRVGFDEELAEEADAICATFGLDHTAFRRVIRDERDVVRVAGRYRHVTPLLLAIWIGRDTLQRYGGAELALLVATLPEGLFDRFIEQAENFGPDPEMQDVMRTLLGGDHGPFGDLAAIAGTSARLLRAAARIDRRAVIEVLNRTIIRDAPDLLEFRARREVVWTLEYLLWFADVFVDALRILFRLALAETEERIANNATGAVSGVFRVYLGGTSVAYDERVRTLRLLVDEFGLDGARELAVTALRYAFAGHESRSEPDIRGATLPAEWRPPTYGEDWEVRRLAWRSIVELIDEVTDSDLRERLATDLASDLRVVVNVIPAEEIIALLERPGWSESTRTRFAHRIQDVFEFERLPAEAEIQLRDALTHLRGEDPPTFIDFVLRSETWELAENRQERIGTPDAVLQAAARLIENPELLEHAAETARAAETNSSVLVFAELAQRIDQPDEWLERILQLTPPPVPAIAGFLEGSERAGRSEWVTRQLRRLLDDPDLAVAFPPSLHFVAATDERAGLAVEAIAAGVVEGTAFTRLIYGAWTRGLSETAFVPLVRGIAESGTEAGLEAALSILEQWSAEIHEYSEELEGLTTDLVTRSASIHGSQMLPYHRQKLIERIRTPFDTRLSLFLKTIRGGVHLGTEETPLYDSLLDDDVERTLREIIEMILGEIGESGWSKTGLWLADFDFLTHAEHRCGGEAVLAAVQDLSPEERANLMPHFSFAGAQPSAALRAVIDQTHGDDVIRAAAAEFTSYPGSWMGSAIPHLKRRQQEAREWAQLGSERLHEISDLVIPYYDAAIESEQRREAEDPYYR